MPRTRPRDEPRSVWDEALPRVTRLLPAFLAGQRWFGGKGRSVRRVKLVDRADLRRADHSLLTIVEVSYADQSSERYLVPLAVTYGEGSVAAAPIVRYGAVTIGDAFWDDGFCRALLRAVQRGAQVTTARGGTLVFESDGTLGARASGGPPADVRRVGAEQSNTSIIYGGGLILKAYRRIQVGVNPELEILRWLTQDTEFDHVPALVGQVEYRAPNGSVSSVAVLQTFVPNEGDGWSWTLCELRALLGAANAVAAGLAERGHSYFAGLAELGRVTARLHLALASAGGVRDFTPEPIVRTDVESWGSSLAARLDAVLGRLRALPDEHSAPVHVLVEQVLRSEARRRALIGGLDGLLGVAKTRLHGDFHLGQVLKTTDSFVILDFEGEPLRSLAERRALHTPLRDVAGLLRSLSYARHVAVRSPSSSVQIAPEAARDAEPVAPSADLAATWERLARQAFLEAYVEACRAARAVFLPRSDQALAGALTALELDKAVYELEYELDNRPHLLEIPLSFLAETH